MILKYIVIVCLWVFLCLVLWRKIAPVPGMVESMTFEREVIYLMEIASVPVLFFASWKIINRLWLL